MTHAPLATWGGFAALLAMAGLPIYIHAPKFYADSFGIGLGTLGLVLGALRLIDLVQDPALGWLARATSARRGASVAMALIVLAGAMLGLFAVVPPVTPILWFALMLTALFSAYSFLTIVFYAQGIRRAEPLGTSGHLQLAAWRESGALLGVCAAAVAPTLLALTPNPPFQAYAVLFAAFALGVGWRMRAEWRGQTSPDTSSLSDFGRVLRDPLARRLLVVALVNTAPVAVSSTLFLFFVESRLAAPGWDGPLLVLFFFAAAGAAPLWVRAARQYGTRRVLMLSMGLSIASFGAAALLDAGDAPAFAVICILTGAALGAALTLLPALFARRMAHVAPEGAAGFALWTFATKATLALCALVLLPMLDSLGFSGPDSSPQALAALGLIYALLPCALKLGAIALIATIDPESEPHHA